MNTKDFISQQRFICIVLMLITQLITNVVLSQIQQFQVEEIKNISCKQAIKLIKKHKRDTNFVIVDFRPLAMFSESHIENAIFHDVFLPDIDKWLLSLDKSKTYLIYCTVGHRSGIASSKMKEMKFENIYHMNEGIIKWKEQGYKVVSNQKESEILKNLLNNPESVVYDSFNKRYLISNWGNGSIVQIDRNGVQSYFNRELQGKYKIAGLYIYNDTLLAASGDTLKSDTSGRGLTGFDLKSGKIIFHIPIPGIGLPNDICSDKNGIIYLSDYWGNKLYKIENRKPSIFIRENLNYPNGITYDKENNRLLILSVGGKNTPIFEVNLPDTTVFTVIETGFVRGLDGIDMDNEGRIYVSEWGNDRVYRYDKNLNEKPVLFSKGHNDPADIYIDKVNNILVVPNFSSNTVDFIPIVKNKLKN